MAKPEVKMVRSTATQANREPVWEVIVDYGGGVDQITAPSSRRFVLCPTPLVRRWSHDMVESALRSDGAIFAAMSTYFSMPANDDLRSKTINYPSVM